MPALPHTSSLDSNSSPRTGTDDIRSRASFLKLAAAETMSWCTLEDSREFKEWGKENIIKCLKVFVLNAVRLNVLGGKPPTHLQALRHAASRRQTYVHLCTKSFQCARFDHGSRRRGLQKHSCCVIVQDRLSAQLCRSKHVSMLDNYYTLFVRWICHRLLWPTAHRSFNSLIDPITAKKINQR